MEKLNLVNNGVRSLPPGFRFHPTDEELVVQYLKRKVQSFPLPASIIPEADVCKSDPWDLPGDSEQERFFFSIREVKYPNGKRSNRATISGFWKATGLDKKIVDSQSNQVVGMKKTLVFYQGKPPHGSKSNWVMHEYRLVNPIQDMERWVICKIFLKKKGRNVTKRDTIQETKSVFYDFMAATRNDDLDLNGASSSSGSSGITKASNGTYEEEESSKNV